MKKYNDATSNFSLDSHELLQMENDKIKDEERLSKVDIIGPLVNVQSNIENSI